MVLSVMGGFSFCRDEILSVLNVDESKTIGPNTFSKDDVYVPPASKGSTETKNERNVERTIADTNRQIEMILFCENIIQYK